MRDVLKGRVVPSKRNSALHVQPAQVSTLRAAAGSGGKTLVTPGIGEPDPGKAGWKFSFNLKELLGADSPVTDSTRRQKEADLVRGAGVDGSQRIDPNLKWYSVEPGALAVEKNRDLPPSNTDLRQVMQEPVSKQQQLQKRTVDMLPAKHVVNPEKRVLFSDEERAAYKSDPVSVNIHRPNIADRVAPSMKGLAAHRGVTDHLAMSRQFDAAETVQPGRTINSVLRAENADAPRHGGIGATKVATDHQVLTKLETRRVAPPRADKILKGGTQGIGRDGVNMFPRTEQEPEGTTWFRGDRKEITAQGADAKKHNIARFTKASQPGLPA